LHKSDTILRNVVGDGRAQHVASFELVDVYGEAFLTSRICRRDSSINSSPRHNFNVCNSLGKGCRDSQVD
jgi:hypothetical protein